MKRTKLRTVRVTAEEDEMLERVARRRRVSVSELMRLLPVEWPAREEKSENERSLLQ